MAKAVTQSAANFDKDFLKVLNGQRTEKVPFWLMRQAGRYLPEYRELRGEKGGFLAMAFDPDTACEITMQPIRRYGMDAAIIFSDILVVPYALGQNLEFEKGEGPKLNPVRDARTLAALSVSRFDEKLEPVYQALRNVRTALVKENFSDTALIGFAGAPWTVATYMVEGGGSKDFAEVKKLAYAAPDFFTKLIDLLVECTGHYLVKKIEAGAEAVQLFDSWAGVLDEAGFERWVIAPTKRIVQHIRSRYPDVPIIGFPKGAGHFYLRYVQQTGVSAIGLDSQMPMSYARDQLQPLVPVQGNMDPMVLLASKDIIEKEAMRILNGLSGGPFVFNLGHGVNKDTLPENIAHLASVIRNYKLA